MDTALASLSIDAEQVTEPLTGADADAAPPDADGVEHGVEDERTQRRRLVGVWMGAGSAVAAMVAVSWYVIVARGGSAPHGDMIGHAATAEWLRTLPWWDWRGWSDWFYGGQAIGVNYPPLGHAWMRFTHPVHGQMAAVALGLLVLLPWGALRLARAVGCTPRAQRAAVAAALVLTAASANMHVALPGFHLIEAAMRHLRAVTVGRLREKPAVLAVRVGTYGFEVLLNRPVQPPEGWQAASGGYVLELPQGVTADDLDTTAQGPTLCPALVPVGDTLEGPLLLNVEEIGCLIVSGPGSPSVNLLNAVVGTLGSSPLAGDIRIITVGLDTPAGLPGWERVHSTSFDSPQLEELLSAAHTGSGASLDILIVGPGNDLLIQRAGPVATTPGSRLALVGATSSVAARWPWRIHVDETTTAVVHPIACTMAAAQAMAPAMSQLLSEATDPSLFAPPRF